MTRRFPRAKWVLPDVIDPPERLCFTIEVPNNRLHIAAFRGALLNLASAINWQDDPDHTAKEVAKVWDKVYLGVKACVECDTSTGIALEDILSQQIRISPDNSCIIQMWCIDHWEDWYNPLACVPGAVVQPGDGGELTPGECRTFEAVLQGNGKWLLPIQVNEGDVVTITGAAGVWNDGSLGWNCASGQVYILGACGASDAADVGDPLQTVNHMRLVAEVDGDFYDAFNQTIGIPAGVTNENMTFQANDGSLEDNTGSISFTVEVCAAGATPLQITYTLGSGVSIPTIGNSFVVTAEATPYPAQPDIYAIRMITNKPGTLRLVSMSGWTILAYDPNDEVWGYSPSSNPSAWPTGWTFFRVNTPSTGPTMPFDTCINGYDLISLTPFSAVFQFLDEDC